MERNAHLYLIISFTPGMELDYWVAHLFDGGKIVRTHEEGSVPRNAHPIDALDGAMTWGAEQLLEVGAWS